jgi:hypothetical protein
MPDGCERIHDFKAVAAPSAARLCGFDCSAQPH